MVYFTFGESPSGVYNSQVIDTVNLIRKQGRSIRLVSMVSPTVFLSVRKELKKKDSSIVVIPYLFKLGNFDRNTIVLKLFSYLFKNKLIICRGVLATNLVLSAFKKNKVVYDGRAASFAEQAEFGVYNGTGLENKIKELERRAVLETDYQVAVSKKLVDCWTREFDYNKSTYQVIPCLTSLDRVNPHKAISSKTLNEFFQRNNDKIKLVFSGGKGKWQNLGEVARLIDQTLTANENTCAILLIPSAEMIEQVQHKFPDRVIQAFVKADEVQSILAKCDYGILLRENLITNEVASPVKVAEYLLAGLKVIISENVGDYSSYIETHNLGVVYKGQLLSLSRSTEETKKEIAHKAAMNFSKEKFEEKFYQF